MRITSELTTERVSFPNTTKLLDEIANEARDTPGFENITDDQVSERVETILLEKIKDGDKPALFQLGLLYFHQEKYHKAKDLFDRARASDFQALFMYGIMLYDGLGCEVNMKEALKCMMDIAEAESRQAKHLVHAACYNIGRAYFQGYGNLQSDSEAEKFDEMQLRYIDTVLTMCEGVPGSKQCVGVCGLKWWMLAADDGNPRASVKAQSILGMFYSRQEQHHLDLKKAFFWHSEACGNGSLESQGALGVMYMLGLGTKKNMDASYVCLKEASERGNVYAMGNLVLLYYKNKLYTKACDLGSKVSGLNEEDVSLIASETDCLPSYIAKGISMACFVYARCLAGGHSLKQNKSLAESYYSKSYRFDPDVCALLQHTTQQGAI